VGCFGTRGGKQSTSRGDVLERSGPIPSPPPPTPCVNRGELPVSPPAPGRGEAETPYGAGGCCGTGSGAGTPHTGEIRGWERSRAQGPGPSPEERGLGKGRKGQAPQQSGAAGGARGPGPAVCPVGAGAPPGRGRLRARGGTGTPPARAKSKRSGCRGPGCAGVGCPTRGLQGDGGDPPRIASGPRGRGQGETGIAGGSPGSFSPHTPGRSGLTEGGGQRLSTARGPTCPGDRKSTKSVPERGGEEGAGAQHLPGRPPVPVAGLGGGCDTPGVRGAGGEGEKRRPRRLRGGEERRRLPGGPGEGVWGPGRGEVGSRRGRSAWGGVAGPVTPLRTARRACRQETRPFSSRLL